MVVASWVVRAMRVTRAWGTGRASGVGIVPEIVPVVRDRLAAGSARGLQR